MTIYGQKAANFTKLKTKFSAQFWVTKWEGNDKTNQDKLTTNAFLRNSLLNREYQLQDPFCRVKVD